MNPLETRWTVSRELGPNSDYALSVNNDKSCVNNMGDIYGIYVHYLNPIICKQTLRLLGIDAIRRLETTMPTSAQLPLSDHKSLFYAIHLYYFTFLTTLTTF